MEQKDLDYFENLLTQWLDELLGKAGNTVVGLISSEDHLADPLDRAAFDSERSYTLRIRDRESVLIKKINASLNDIEDGVYGICDECGTEISIKRLKARPVARRCIQCKTKQEQRERLTGVR
jgi:DnaK suppressor protein